MVLQKKKRRKNRGDRRRPQESVESRTSEVLTVAWTVTLTTLFFCDLAVIAAHFYVVAYPPAQRMAMLRELLLHSGALVGLLSLGLIPLVYRLRRTPPPSGLVVFGTCLALAPILAVVLRMVR
jgi:hypothetical protein